MASRRALMRRATSAAVLTSSGAPPSLLRSSRAPARGWSFLPGAPERRLERLREAASARPMDAEAHAAFLRALAEVRPAEVVSQVEAGNFAGGPSVAREYVRALARTRALEPSKLPHVLAALGSQGAAQASKPIENAFGARPQPVAAAAAVTTQAGGTGGGSGGAGSGTTGGGAADAGAGGLGPGAFAGLGALNAQAASGAGSAAAGAGTAAAPLQVALAEPSLQSQLWRLVRALGSTFLLLGFLGVLMEERGGGGMARINTSAEPEPETSDPVTFADVAGANEAKEELEEIVEYLRNPGAFTRLGGKVPTGVLLVGPPGTGKTLLAKAVAGEAHRPFFYASGSSFEELYVGVGAKRVRELFAAARRNAPCIVFIDEIDAMGAKRSPRDASYVKLAFFELLQALDGFRSNESVIVIAATNNPESLDPALVRPGRFDRHITVPNPDVVGRREILTVHSKGVPMAEDVDLDIIARSTPGFSGADLSNLVNTAAVKAAVDRKDFVNMNHLEFAKDKILMGAERKSTSISEETRRLTAYHEGGHALAALYTKGALPVHKATIVPRGRALGMVSQLPDKDQTSMSREQMIAKLVVCMGGRAAEELFLGPEHVTSGAQSDFAQATNLAEAMVTQFGMSQKMGHMVYERASESPDARARIEEEVRDLLESAYGRAKSLLKDRETELHNVASALLDRETLSGKEVQLAAMGRLPPLPPMSDAKKTVAQKSTETMRGTDVLDAPNATDVSECPKRGPD